MENVIVKRVRVKSQKRVGALLEQGDAEIINVMYLRKLI
jgi:hypothetical protein